MTKPRHSTTRELHGLLGTLPHSSQILKEWNGYFTQQKIDACMSRYPCTVEKLPERLSEMFHFDRRVYLVAEPLQQAVIPLLDILDTAVNNRVNVIVNNDGILSGYLLTEQELACENLLELVANL